MANIITERKKRLRVKEVQLPVSSNQILGDGIDAMKLPEGHLSCPQCGRASFECWNMLDSHRIEIGCLRCGWSNRLLLPYDVDVSRMGKGKYSCKKHPERGWIIIHNSKKLCIGCESCATQVILDLDSKNNLVIADG